MQPLGRGYGPHLAEGTDFLAQIVPEGIRGRAGQIFQQAVQHRGFELLELLLRRLAGVQAKGRKLVREFFQPGFGQTGIRAVLELHVTFAAAPGFPDFFQGQGLALIVHVDVQGEPFFFFVARHLCGDG